MKLETNIKNTQAGSDCQERLVSRSSVAEQFARYRENRQRQYQIESRRGGSFGIAVHKDDDAVAWQSLSRDVEESQAYLENREPIPERWGGKSPANAKGDAPI